MRISDWSSDVVSSDIFAIGGAHRLLRFLLACQESAEGRLPVAGRPYLACIVERAGLPLNEEPGPVRRFLVVERRIPFRAFQIGRRVNEENRSLAASVRSHACGCPERRVVLRSEEHTSELQTLMRISYAVFCCKKKSYSNSNVHSNN